VNHDRSACQGPTIGGDVLSLATAESGDDLTAPFSAAVPNEPHAGSLAAKPCGTSTNRTAAAASAARERTTRSSPDGHKKISPNRRLGAHPRARPRRPARKRPAPPLAARGPARDSGNSADGGTPGHGLSAARSGWHANAASGPLHPDTPHRNTAPGRTRAGRTARSLSIGSDAAVAPDKSLALKKIVDHDEVDPRERQLPTGQVPERSRGPLRDALYPRPYPPASLRSRLITPVPGRHLPAGRPPPPTTAGHPPCWSANWFNARPPLTSRAFQPDD